MKIEQKVIDWARERQLISEDNVHQQMLKLVEEVGELSSALLNKDKELTIDAIGDIEVVLTILCEQLGLSKKECFKSAYNEIKNRTGKTINGTFIKD